MSRHPILFSMTQNILDMSSFLILTVIIFPTKCKIKDFWDADRHNKLDSHIAQYVNTKAYKVHP